jgi:hypothetical protein
MDTICTQDIVSVMTVRDLLNDRVAVAILVGQRHEDVEGGGRQRKRRLG